MATDVELMVSDISSDSRLVRDFEPVSKIVDVTTGEIIGFLYGGDVYKVALSVDTVKELGLYTKDCLDCLDLEILEVAVYKGKYYALGSSLDYNEDEEDAFDREREQVRLSGYLFKVNNGVALDNYTAFSRSFYKCQY